MVARTEKISAWVWVALAALVLLALAVIFVLPKVVEEYELPLTPRVSQAPAISNSPVAAQPAGPAISPFEEAQMARLRREAQDALASLLQRQTDLEVNSVSEWAAEAYNSAIAAARRGDEFYRTGNYADAARAYQESDQALAALQSQRRNEFERVMTEAEAAMVAGDAETALAQFSLAALIDPSSVEADKGVRRAQVLDQVETLLAEGRLLQQNGDLQIARERFREAAALDSEHPRIAELVAENEQLQLEARFNAAMSEGFALLQQSLSDEAVTAFERALQIKPGNIQAEEAINQTRTEITLAEIAAQRERALELENQENWAEAVAAYQQVLELDPNLVFAQEGLDYSQRRLQLDTLLQTNLDDPVRLSDSAALFEAEEVYNIAADLLRDLQTDTDMTAGPRLTSQVERTGELLQTMQVPVPVTLLSDNNTQVTIYQVGQFGAFSEKILELKPGRYVAVGTRPGYRDVREEFVVGFGQSQSTLSIQCSEQVQIVNRR
jgi:tetratricopeptide (TPR) repeat protein